MCRARDWELPGLTEARGEALRASARQSDELGLSGVAVVPCPASFCRRAVSVVIQRLQRHTGQGVPQFKGALEAPLLQVGAQEPGCESITCSHWFHDVDGRRWHDEGTALMEGRRSQCAIFDHDCPNLGKRFANLFCRSEAPQVFCLVSPNEEHIGGQGPDRGEARQRSFDHSKAVGDSSRRTKIPRCWLPRSPPDAGSSNLRVMGA